MVLRLTLSEGAVMPVVLTIKESHHGLWCICSGVAVLYDRLGFAHAIRLARGLAREEHVSSGQTVSVTMVSAEFTISLVQYEASTLLQRPSASLERAVHPRGLAGRHASQPRYV